MLELRGLTRRYGDHVALDDVSFSVAPGEMLGFVGPNGAGKTTAMRIVLGVLEPDAGTVSWRGRPVDASVRRRFGYMPEERGLYPKMRVRDQLVYLACLHGMEGADAGRAADHWIERLGVTSRAADSRQVASRRQLGTRRRGAPSGPEASAVEQLSLGNQQRVQLAAALVHDPELLVLDEPFSGLDPVGVDVLAGILTERAAQGVAVVFSSHQLELVERLCRSVAILRAGRIVASGAVEQLRTAGRRRRLRVEVPGAGGDWVAALAGVQVIEKLPDGVVVELADGVDPSLVLDAARGAGQVRHFSEVEPTLTDLFREAVAA